jgi:hypothetical protein
MKKVLVGMVAVAVFAFGGSTVFAGAAAPGAAGKVGPGVAGSAGKVAPGVAVMAGKAAPATGKITLPVPDKAIPHMMSGAHSSDHPSIHEILTSKVEVSEIKSIQVVNDTFVFGYGGEYTIEFTAPYGDTNLGAGKSITFVGLYDAGRTSDPTSGGSLIPGTIAGLPTFTSPTSGSIKISTATTAPGSYWLRFQTMLTDGSWEIAEGILMVH